MLEIQKFFHTYEGAEELLTEHPYNLIVKRDGEYILLKYSMIGSDMGQPLVKECRGIILRYGTWDVVCRPFDKFFNVQESRAAEIDWSTALVSEKMDGSHIKVWHDKNIWNVSTNGTIFAVNAEIVSMNPVGKTFYSLFMDASKKQRLDWRALDKECTYLFELCSPFNKIVVHYPDVKILHLATRVTANGEYVEHDVGIEKPRVFPVSSEAECLAAAEHLPFNEEGYVVRDAQGNMIKIKSPAYVAAHRLVNNGVVTPKRIIGIVALNEQDEFLSYFPEYTDAFGEIIEKFEVMKADAEEIVDFLKDTKFKKESRGKLAQYAKSTCAPHFAFAYHDGHVENFTEWFLGLTENSRTNMMGY